MEYCETQKRTFAVFDEHADHRPDDPVRSFTACRKSYRTGSRIHVIDYIEKSVCFIKRRDDTFDILFAIV